MDRLISGTEWFFLGADIGQVNDPTAVAGIERVEVATDFDPVLYADKKEVRLRLRYLDRFPLGTPYPEIARRLATLTRAPGLAGHCHLIADATGVGRPIIDLLRDSNLSCRLMPVVITGGDHGAYDAGYYRQPKRDLIIGLQLLLQQGALQIAGSMPLAPVLAAELADMQVRRTPAGHEQYGVWREGRHDDLVLAVALACWGARELYPRPLYGPNGHCSRIYG